MSNTIFEVQDEFFLSMAVFSAFIDKGMRSSPAFAALATSADREIELVEGAAGFALMAVSLEQAALEAGGTQSAVHGDFEQTVCEPFGFWYAGHCADHGGSADEGICRDRMANVIIDYLSKDLSPLHRWSVVRAVKAAEPAVRLSSSIVAESINWEWAPRRCEITADMRALEQHPVYRRSDWAGQFGPAHISEYWQWVEHSMQEGYVRGRYEALAGARNIFAELLNADMVLVDGRCLSQLHVRRDLVAQEYIDVLPAHTLCSNGLFSALPGLFRAFRELNQQFSLDDWIARPVTDFLTEYATAVDPETTVIVAGNVHREGSMPPVAYSLTSLWCAEPAQAGCWRLEDGTALSLLPGDNTDAAAAMRSGFLVA